MDARFNRFNSFGFAANPALNANMGNPFQIGGGAAANLGNPFQIGGGAAANLGNPFQIGGGAAANLGNPFQIGRAAGGGNGADTTLRLDSSGLSTTPTGSKRKWGLMHKSVRRIESSLSLGLGHSSTSSDSKGSSATACTSASSAKEVESSSMDVELDFSLHLGSEKIPIPWKSGRPVSKGAEVWPKVDLELSLSSCAAESDVTAIQLSSTPPQSSLKSVDQTFNFEDRTVSPSSVMGSFYHHFPTPDRIQTGFCLNKSAVEIIGSSATAPELSASIITTPKSSVTCSSGLTHQSQRSNNTKQCQFYGCGKGARGASGLCIAHGGGRRCQRPGCLKGAEGRTAFCKAHGGGRRCEFLGCTKSAEGKTDLCIAHGGGRRCSNEGCNRAARGKSGLCIRHGGGKRCQRENCTKSAEGLSGLCISHGGGRRCQYPECSKGAQGSTMFCKAHGGGKRCTHEGCTKGAEGSTPYCKGHGGGKRCSFHGGGKCPKSVHGGTLYCVAHGGGKRCAVPECTKSARGRTDYCVRHGGGKRCKSVGCGKSAQGSTDFCKAHGGGKRCSWGHPGSEFGVGENICNSFARGKSGLCASHSALDKCVHGCETAAGVIVHDSEPQITGIVDIIKMDSRSISSSLGGSIWSQAHLPGTAVNVNAMPEGRVHGGGLMAMLGDSGLNLSGSAVVGPYAPGQSWIPENWN